MPGPPPQTVSTLVCPDGECHFYVSVALPSHGLPLGPFLRTALRIVSNMGETCQEGVSAKGEPGRYHTDALPSVEEMDDPEVRGASVPLTS